MRIERLVVLGILVIVIGIVVPTGSKADAGTILVLNNFESDPVDWRIYNWWLEGEIARDSFSAVSVENHGGVDDSGYIWADDTRWGIDWPDTSILCFVTYGSWQGIPSLDLRSAQVTVYLRAESLDLKGGRIYFWVLDGTKGTRYHYVAHPLSVEEGVWVKNTFRLEDNQSLWYRSWSRDYTNVASLHDTLGMVDSYGISFRGFSNTGKVKGRLEMSKFSMTASVPQKIFLPFIVK